MIFIIGRENLADLNGNRDRRDTLSFALDGSSDISLLPGIDKVQGGSTALVIDTGKVLILGSEGWREI